MGRTNRERVGRRVAVLGAVVAVALACGWMATGFSSGFVFAIAIGVATAIAVFSDTKGACAPRFLRRRD